MAKPYGRPTKSACRERRPPALTSGRVTATLAVTLVIVGLAAIVAIGFVLYRDALHLPHLLPDLGPPEVGVPMQCPNGTVSNGAGLCFDSCPDGYDWDHASFCYKKCPADWSGSSSLTHCQKDRKYSRGQSVLEIGACPPGTERKAALCYDVCPPGWDRRGTLDCYENCPAGFSDNGLYCAKPGPQTRRSYCWGIHNQPHWDDPRRSCEEENGQGCEQSAPTCWIPKCGPGFHGAGVALCSPNCPPGWDDIGVSCKKPANMTSGHPKTLQCPPNHEELSPSMCYEQCQARYQRVRSDIEFCTSVCPPDTVDIGIGGCQKDKKTVSSHALTGVGVCVGDHPHKKGDLCYSKS